MTGVLAEQAALPEPEMAFRKKALAPAMSAEIVPASKEERAYLEVQAHVERRVAFYKHVVTMGAVVIFLLFVAGWDAAVTVGLIWGIFVAIRAYSVIWAPDLRRRWIAEEMARANEVFSKERKQIQGRHAKDLETLSASIAHEIRNPITAAKSLVQQMGEDPASQENVDYAKIALEELDRVERSISHLLRYAREEPMRSEPVDLKEIVESAVETFRLDRHDRPSPEITVDGDESVPLSADADQLRRVVINLVSNALDAFEENATASPRLLISFGRNLSGDEAWLTVEDNGPGIEPDRLEKIWSPFHTSKTRGTGLGLAITKKIVEAHRGTITCESEPGKGTTFSVRLPGAKDDA